MKLPNSGIGKLVLENFEKAIFGVIALLGLYLIYSAFSAEKYPSDKIPDKLIKEASRAKELIHEPRWENFKDNYKDETPELLDQLAKAKPLEPNYPHSVVLEGERLQLTKRFDPVLLAVQDLEVHGVWDSILWDGGRNYVSSLPEGELRERAGEKKKKKKKAKPKRTVMRGGGEDDEGMREMMKQMQEEQESMEAMSEKMESSSTPASASSLPEQIAKEMAGVRVTNGKGKGLVGGYFVSVTGIVPFRQQVIEFRKLSQTLRYDAETDYPRYVKVDVERMDASVPDGRWENITEKLQQFPERSHMMPPEVCDLSCYDERIAMQSLPLLRTDPSAFGLHSKIPQRVWFEEEEEEVVEDVEPAFDADGLPIVPETSTKSPRTGTDMDRFSMVRSPRPKAGPKDLEPADAPEFKLVRFSDYVLEGKSYKYRVRLILIDPNLPISVVSGKKDDRSRGDFARNGEGPDEGEMERMMMEMAASEGSEMGDMETDTTAVKLTHGNSRINESNLEATVRDRLDKLKNSERFKLEDEDLKFGIYTGWSEPSPVVTAPKPEEQFFAGRIVEAPSTRQHANVSFEVGQPSVELVMSKWSPEYRYKLPVFGKVFKGSTLNLKQTIKLIDPIDLKVREIRGGETEDSTEKEPKYQGHEIDSSAIVLDISGGNTIAGKQRSEKVFKTPAEVLVFDGENFVLSDELEDMREFREHALFEVDEDVEEK